MKQAAARAHCRLALRRVELMRAEYIVPSVLQPPGSPARSAAAVQRAALQAGVAGKRNKEPPPERNRRFDPRRWDD